MKLSIILFFFLSSSLIWADEVSIPLIDKNWHSLSYRKIQPNQVSFVDSNLNVNVDNSAGPLVYQFEKPMALKSFVVEFDFTGDKKIETGEFDEDSILRVGFVATGDKKLSGFKRLFAAEWVKKLFALVPEDAGLDKIYFYNVSNRESLLNHERIHPQSDLIWEKVIKVASANGHYKIEIPLNNSKEMAGLWLSIDGDNSDSHFKISIKNITLQK